MEEGSQVVSIYHPPSSDLLQVKRSIASAVGADVTPEQIILKEKTQGITAFVELPTQLANSLTQKKNIIVEGKSLPIKPFFCDHQIFINKLPSSINTKDVEEYFDKFGKVLSVKIISVNTNYEARHCYIKFQTEKEADDIIYHERRHIIKNQQIRVHRTYGIGESDQTDKKLFLKIQPKLQKIEEMEKTLHSIFRKYGGLRERIRIEETTGNSNKAIITFISHEDAEIAFKNQKDINIDKYHLILRPIASDLAIYASGLKPEVSEEEVRKTFQIYGKVIECRLNSKNNSKSATINYANEQVAKQVLAQYRESDKISTLFNFNKPKLTIHMTTRQRNEFLDYNRKNKKQTNWQQPMQPFMQPMIPQQNMMMGQAYMRNQPPYPQYQNKMPQTNYIKSTQVPQMGKPM